MDIKVIKRDGAEEAFDVEKIATSVTSAGLKPEEGKNLAQEVDKWVKSLGKNKIKSMELRDKVVDLMRKVNVEATTIYTWFEEQKNLKIIEEKKKDQE